VFGATLRKVHLKNSEKVGAYWKKGSRAVKDLGIEVFGQIELETRINEPHYSHLVSIGNPISLFTINRPDTAMPRIFKKRFKKILRLSFYDVEKKSHLSRRQFPKRVPKKSDIRRAIQFFNASKGETDGYTLHCWQGVSRSTAFALGFLYMITGSEDTAVMILKNIRPDAHPHPGIVNMFDEELGCNLTSVNEILRKEWIEKMKKELDLTEDSLLEDLETVEDE
jgi:predicted protein tyrosine phosphatase